MKSFKDTKWKIKRNEKKKTKNKKQNKQTKNKQYNEKTQTTIFLTTFNFRN